MAKLPANNKIDTTKLNHILLKYSAIRDEYDDDSLPEFKTLISEIIKDLNGLQYQINSGSKAINEGVKWSG